MHFQLLGPVEVEVSGEILPLPRRRVRCLLALLLLDANQVVPVSRLAELLWDGEPPGNSRHLLYSQVSRLRAVLTVCGGHDQVTVATVGTGYRIEVDLHSVDVHRFRMLLRSAAGTSDLADRADLLRSALDLWRGQALENAASPWLRDRVCADLAEQRLAALEDLMSASLALRREREVLPELANAAAAFPSRESLIALQMRALYQADRKVQALEVYERTRAYLADELGLDPGRKLRELHQAVLRDQLDVPASPAKVIAGSQAAPRYAARKKMADYPSGGGPVPCQLPADVTGFTGSGAYLDHLDALLTRVPDATAVVVAAISGTAGVGKTALAVHWAHRVRHHFPDGQLYVNLRGYDPDQPMAPADVLARFLSALGIASQDLPPDLDDRAARFRTQAATRRMLIVLDNAATTEQVRPLLPGNGSCMVVVTSRDSLSGLVAIHGADRIELPPLPPVQAIQLLRLLIGSRVDAEPEAAATLAALCAQLPLALRIAAELAVSRSTVPLTELVAELADQPRRLELLDAGNDSHAAVGVVFSWSFRHLPAPATGAFRLLGLHPGPDIDPYATAALVDTSLAQARRMLDLLTRAHLVDRTSRGRYGMHDLLRSYAIHLTTTRDSAECRHAALTRLFDYYLTVTAAATDRLYPADAHHRPRVANVGPADAMPDLASRDTARAWLDTELPCLVPIVAYAATHGWPTHTIHFSSLLFRYLDGGHFTEALAIHGHARRIAEQADDAVALAHALRFLGATYQQTSQYESAIDQARKALALYERAGHPSGMAYALNSLGVTEARLGRYAPAAQHYQRTLALFQQGDDLHGQAIALNNLGAVEERLGRYASAAQHYQQALTLFQRTGDARGEAYTLTNLGNAERRQGRYAQAAEHHRQALTMFRSIGNLQGEADALDNLGIVHIQLGQATQAHNDFRRALVLFREIGDRDGEAQVCNGLGEAAFAAGNPARALRRHTEALTIATGIGTSAQQARAHTGLGSAHHALGDVDRARTHYQQALALYIEHGMPEAEDLRARLAALP